MKDLIKEVKTTADWIKNRTSAYSPVTAVIAGSGLGKALPDMEDKVEIPYSEIPGFPVTTVKGHAGKLVFGRIGGADAVVMLGRFHYYEGHPISLIAFPIRVLHALGVKNLVLTAAVGSLKTRINPGDFVILNDQINLMGKNPLMGNHDDRFGEMFPDMSEPYDRKIHAGLVELAAESGIKVHEGVYVATTGPSYETPAEVRMYGMLGGDVVGMSVVPENQAARQLRMRVAGICWVSNYGTGISKTALSHEEVMELGEKASVKMKILLEALLKSDLISK